MEVPNYMQMPGVARSLGATVRTFSLRQDTGWEPDWDEFERAVTSRTRLLYLSNPNNPTGSILSRGAMERIVSRCESTGTWILADEVYLGAEIDWRAHDELLGHERPRDRHERSLEGLRHPGRARGMDGRPAIARVRVLVAARLPHDRAEQTVRPPRVASPSSRRIASAATRARAPSSRTTSPSPASGSRRFGGRLTWREPQAGAIALVQLRCGHQRASRSPSACGSTRARSSCPGRTSVSRAICGSGSAAARSSSARACGASRSELTPLFD